MISTAHITASRAATTSTGRSGSAIDGFSTAPGPVGVSSLTVPMLAPLGADPRFSVDFAARSGRSVAA